MKEEWIERSLAQHTEAKVEEGRFSSPILSSSSLSSPSTSTHLLFILTITHFSLRHSGINTLHILHILFDLSWSNKETSYFQKESFSVCGLVFLFVCLFSWDLGKERQKSSIHTLWGIWLLTCWWKTNPKFKSDMLTEKSKQNTTD